MILKIKVGPYLNIKRNTFKDSYVNTSECKYWKIVFDSGYKDDTCMYLSVQSCEDE